MIAVGIDPGTANPGLAYLRRDGARWRLLHSPVLTSVRQLCAHLWAHQEWLVMSGATVAVEDLSWLQAAENVAHGNKSYQIIRCAGVAELLATSCRAPLIEVRAETWRKCLGLPKNATKVAARNMLYKLVDGMPPKLSLNRSDAIAIAVAGAMKARAR